MANCKFGYGKLFESFVYYWFIDFILGLKSRPEISPKIVRYNRNNLILIFVDSVRWPAGTYGLPKPASGCPMADGFQWEEGWRSQDLHGTRSNNAKSTEFHLDAKVDYEKVNRTFCIKGRADQNDRPKWPPGW